MKTKNLLLAVITIAFIGCDKYLVPDNFPKEDFYSYAPYQVGDTVHFAAEGADSTLTFIVEGVYNEYYRGERNCKCGKENAYQEIKFSQGLFLLITCSDRAKFRVSLYTEYNPNIDIDASYNVNYSKDEDIWAESYDETKIFKHFTEELTLYQSDEPAAKIKKKEGILWFTTSDGTTWNVCK